MKSLLLGAAALALSACADVGFQHVYDHDTGFTYTNLKSGCEVAGGPRQDIILITDSLGKVRGSWQAAGDCTLQTVGNALAGSVPIAAGTLGAAAVLRPSSTTTNTSVSTTQSGGNIAPDAAVATASPVNSANARGGRGGTAYGNGGNAYGGTAVATGGTGYGGNATATGGTSSARATSAATAKTAARATADQKTINNNLIDP